MTMTMTSKLIMIMIGSFLIIFMIIINFSSKILPKLKELIKIRNITWYDLFKYILSFIGLVSIPPLNTN